MEAREDNLATTAIQATPTRPPILLGNKRYSQKGIGVSSTAEWNIISRMASHPCKQVHIHKQMHKSSIQAYRLQFLLEGLP